MHFIYLDQSGKPVGTAHGNFWTLGAVAVPADKWKILQIRLNGLQRSFQKENYSALQSHLDANDLLHPRNAEKRWTRAICKGLERIVASLELKFFLVVVDKRTTDKPAHPRWLLPLSYHYLLKPVSQYLREVDDTGLFVVPPGRNEEARVISELQVENLFGTTGKSSPLIASPAVQSRTDAVGLQVADFVASVARRYHETIYPKLYAKTILHGYDAIINSHYQGFVKPNTYQSSENDFRGFRIRGYIYLWRRDAKGQLRDDQASSTEVNVRALVDASEQDVRILEH